MPLPLTSIRIVEFEGIGPGPLAARMLTDFGAEVTVIVKPQGSAVSRQLAGDGERVMRRGKRVVTLDLKQPSALEEARTLVCSADALIEGNRPGVMERLGLGPSSFAGPHPRLVYARMTGWGQRGPLANAAGHDLNYIALTGLLSLSARNGQPPMAPPTVLGDAAGALGLAFGLVCAVLESRHSGRGRVVDGAIVDVVAMLGGIAQMVRSSGQLDGEAPSPFHDSPFYDVYACAAGGYITIGSLEPQFYALLLQKLGMTDVNPATQYDKSTWPALKARMSSLFASRTRSHWCQLLEGSDVCFAPVLSVDEAVHHPHNKARGVYAVDESGMVIPAAAPQFAPLAADHTG